VSTHIQDAIATLEQELEGIDQRRGELVRAIDALRPLAGEASHRRAKKAKKRTNERTNERAKRGPGRALRSLPDDAETGPQENGRRQKILALLQEGSFPTREIAKRLAIDRRIVKMALQRMKKVGLVRSTGVGPGTRWTLPGRPAKEAP
jgi:predicted HTH transcriptional regulator